VSRVLVLCPDYPAPSGGVRKLYRHVDVLNCNGIASLLVHTEPGFRCLWFAHDTAIAYRGDLRLTPDDVLVVPEVFGPGLAALAPGIRKVVFNQNAYLLPERNTLRTRAQRVAREFCTSHSLQALGFLAFGETWLR
jgi:hypothetical protein